MTTPTTSTHDLVIIGSGPAGYTAAIYAARARLDTVVLEGSLSAGGALMTTTEVENFPGFPEGVLGPDLMARLREQAVKFGATLVEDDAVTAELTGDIKRVSDSDGNTYESKAVILATGSAYRRLGIPDEDRLAGKGVSWCATCDGFFFRGQDIAVVGGGDSALEEAIFLTRFASTVTIVHRRDELRASAIMQERAKNHPQISFAWNSQVTAIHGADTVEGIELTDTVTGEKRDIPLTGLFIAIGQVPRHELFTDEVTLDEAGFVVVDHPGTRTNLPGVFACGDVVDRIYRQAITAAASGCRAALDAQHYLADVAHHEVGSTSTQV
ncbi:MAG: thioredoxin-disulfide reductase [Propionibacteriaceae bacterium]|jgi:thioredoxin reductase (NADPH)|nr:thioredoxin-disulfide reductase [Propionibacteriaceae bacterium]